MDKLDEKILNIIQEGLPLCPQPYTFVAEKAGTTEGEVLERIADFQKKGLIRRLSGFFQPRKIGYESVLCALWVPPERIEEISALFAEYEEITHNYLRRDDVYNMWFTLIAYGREETGRLLKELESRSQLKIGRFPARKLFKIKVQFHLGEKHA